MKKNILLADCFGGELKSLVKGLSENGNEYEVKCHPANWGRTGIISELRRYANYFWVAFRYFLGRKKYNDIVCWQQFYALIFAFYCNLFKVKKTNRVIACNYTYKEKKKVKGIYFWFMKKCLARGYVDYLHVLSFAYAKQISEQFQFPMEKIIVTPFGLDDEFERYKGVKAPDGYQSNGYMVSMGRSNRDFHFLIDAWRGIDYPLVIISDTFTGDTDNPNILIKRDVSGEAQFPWLIHCKAMIIPIEDGAVCSGDTVLLKGMSFEKIVVVTEPSTLAEMYVKPEKNGLTVKKEAEPFQKLVERIIHGEYDYIGKEARADFLKNYSRYSLGTRIGSAIR